MTQRQNPATVGAFLDLLARAFVPELEIEVAPDQVYLQQGGKSLYLQPFVVLDASANEPRVLSVGEEPPATSATVRVDIFDPKSPASPAERKFECLEAFFRFAIVKLRGGRTALLRPRVHLRGAERLSNAFGGYETVVLRQALLRAGARECLIHSAG